MMALFGITEEGFSKLAMRARPEIWAYGLRNPYSFEFDPKSGQLFIAEVGQNHWEEIDWAPKGSNGGYNYGWKFNMGTHCHPSLGPDDKCPVVGTLPIAEYPHQEPYPGAEKLNEDWGCSVIALGVANYGGMSGVFLTGDWCSGRVFGSAWDGKKWQMQELTQTSLQFTGGDSPLDVAPPPGETFTDAVKQFRETGTNAYDGNADAVASGKELYNTNCQVCHGKTGAGGMGLNLVDDKVAYPRVVSDVGMFEVIYGGASGAMRGWKGRMTQDEILKVIAYVRSLKK
jgi:cytochrome c(L)